MHTNEIFDNSMASFNLKIKICRLLNNIHEVMVFCGVSQHILTYFISGNQCPNLQKRKKDKKEEKDDMKNYVICGSELVVVF